MLVKDIHYHKQNKKGDTRIVFEDDDTKYVSPNNLWLYETDICITALAQAKYKELRVPLYYDEETCKTLVGLECELLKNHYAFNKLEV